VPFGPPAAASGGSWAGLAIGLTAAFVGVLVLVGVFVVVILLTMGNQITNLFSNVVAALGGS